MTAVEYTKTVINGLKNWVVKQISKAKSELSEQIVQPDWNQNDETAADYVKNRTHYMISPAIIETGYTITLPAWVNAESEHDEIPFALGQVWSTNYGDYTDLPVQQADDGTLYIGVYPDIIGAPFYITSTKMKPMSSWLNNARPAACILTCINAGGQYKTIPEEYFPDTIFRQSNAPVKYGKDANGNIIKTATVQGAGTTASGISSHAEGQTTTASNSFSHAEGLNTEASGYVSHAEGSNTTASGSYSHAEGGNTTASGSYSHAEGSNTTANTNSQHVQGEYNILDTGGSASTRGTYAHIVGNGTSRSNRSNAHTLDWSGNAWFAGNVTVGSGKSVLATVKEVDAKYTKPDDGIPKTDLASDVQASLSRADTLTEITREAIISALGYTPEKQSGTFELIETITLEEDTAGIIRTQEPDGTAYKFTAIGAVVQAEVAEKNTGLTVQAVSKNSTVQAAFISGVLNNTTKRYGYARVYQSDGVWFADGSTAVDGYGWTVNQMTGYSVSRAYNQKVSDNPYITSLGVYSNVSDVAIPAGSIIQIYGVRA